MRKIIFVLCIAISTGCATSRRMDIESLKQMHVDCANKDAQIRYLESQMAAYDNGLIDSTLADRIMSTLKGQQQDQVNKNREFNAAAKNIIWNLRADCPVTQNN